MLKNFIMLFIVSIVMIVVSPISMPFGLFFLGWLVVKVSVFILQYNRSIYKTLVNVPIWKVFFNIGYYGEFLTVKALEGISKNEKFLANIYLNKAAKDNELTEIDVIYINEFGVFVLESKNYSGWIFGTDKSKYWTQTLNRNVKNKFYNPVFQNAGHISALKATLDSRFDNIYKSLIVFSERCQLKNVTVQTPNVYVVKRNHIRHTIKKFNQSVVLTIEDISEIHRQLSLHVKVTDAVKKAHIESIKAEVDKEETVIANAKDVGEQVESDNENSIVQPDAKICPKCGSVMIVRTAQRGENKGSQFWGCNNYPKCKTIETISN
jgi:predicted RNA-binding Zn-ribbon protein involved in translation (DUF1610 family)